MDFYVKIAVIPLSIAAIFLFTKLKICKELVPQNQKAVKHPQDARRLFGFFLKNRTPQYNGYFYVKIKQKKAITT